MGKVLHYVSGVRIQEGTHLNCIHFETFLFKEYETIIPIILTVLLYLHRYELRLVANQ